MLTNLSKLEVKVGLKSYQMLVDMDSPLLDVKEALFQFQKYVGQVEDAVKAQQEKVAADAAAATQVESVVEEQTA